MALRLYFRLEHPDPWHRCEWEKLLAALGTDEATQLAGSEANADVVIYMGGNPVFHPLGAWRPSEELRALARSRKPVLTWESGDHPTGYLAGFYCSLPHWLHEKTRHTTTCYPICYNECIDYFDPAEATTLLGFHGNTTAPIRTRLISLLRDKMKPDEALVHLQAGPWERMFDRSGVPEKRAYAASLRRSRFFLCPRGNGVGSIRLFETLQAARVPVLVSDAYVLPPQIDWKTCAIIVPEARIHEIPDLVRSKDTEWPRLALAARRTWEQHFSPQALLGTLGRETRRLLENGSLTPGLSHRSRILSYLGQRQLKHLAASGLRSLRGEGTP